MARHPQQRLASPSRTLSACIHLIGLCSFANSFRFLASLELRAELSYGGHFQYLTSLGLTIAALTFSLGLLADLTLNHQLFAAKNALSVCSAPLELVVSIMYWGLCVVNKDLVMPPHIRIPFVPDLGIHLAPAVFLVLDLILLSPPWKIRPPAAIAWSLLAGSLYWLWVEWCAGKNGMYPYPILDVLNPKARAALFTSCALLMGLSTMALKRVYGFANHV